MIKEERKINAIKTAINDLGPILPGSISQQFNVCGTPGCRCKDPDNPKKHGPYYQLSFTVQGKSSSLFISKKDIAEVKRRVKRFRKFKRLSAELAQASVELVRNQGYTRS